MKVYDSFLFFNEIDLLKLRRELLKAAVDHFVIVESPTTFSSKDIHDFKEPSYTLLKYHNRLLLPLIHHMLFLLIF